MAPTTSPQFRPNKATGAVDEDRRIEAMPDQQNYAALIAYVFVLPKEAALVSEALRNLVAQGALQSAISFPMTDMLNASAIDSWLSHSDAAKHLGMSESTLYRYAEQERIECRKLCGRLQYRLASLDKFKDQHVRPARHSHRGGCIIASALSSGK